ncbi:MAG: type II toxin-antitoxin system VapC family toxin [Candidatus Pacearchaeota archaeon]|nr:type II toxin-antitoxin system VapC family toxin [Candidatus Pacearchaeota archaeon]
MYCVDSSIIIDVLRGDELLGKRISDLMNQGVEFFINPITLCELYRGAYGHVHRERKIQEINSLIKLFGLSELDVASCEEFGKSYKKIKDNKKEIKDFDLLIGSIAKAHGQTLVTRDNDFGNTNSEVEFW